MGSSSSKTHEEKRIAFLRRRESTVEEQIRQLQLPREKSKKSDNTSPQRTPR